MLYTLLCIRTICKQYTHNALKSEKKFNFGKNLGKHSSINTFSIISTLLYSLTIDHFLMQPFSMCSSLCLTLVS